MEKCTFGWPWKQVPLAALLLNLAGTISFLRLKAIRHLTKSPEADSTVETSEATISSSNYCRCSHRCSKAWDNAANCWAAKSQVCGLWCWLQNEKSQDVFQRQFFNGVGSMRLLTWPKTCVHHYTREKVSHLPQLHLYLQRSPSGKQPPFYPFPLNPASGWIPSPLGC